VQNFWNDPRIYLSKEQFLKFISDFNTIPSFVFTWKDKKEVHIPYMAVNIYMKTNGVQFLSDFSEH
jgi:hypothetical protein